MKDPNPHYAAIPAPLIDGLMRYVVHGVETGGFLRAVLENNLSEAVGRADISSLAVLPLIVSYVYNELPGTCWGSKDVVEAWLANHLERRIAAFGTEA